MEMYIEDFLIQNILINWCMLRLVEITTKSKTNCFKLILSSIVGAGFSVITASVLTSVVAINILKILCATIMIMTAFKTKFKQFAFNFILLFAYTFALCGLITHLCGQYVLTSSGLIFASKINLWLVLIACLLLTYVFEFVARHIRLKIQLNNLIYCVTLKNKNKSLTINAYLDTGNMLNLNGQPVLILDLSSYLKLTEQTYINFLLNDNSNNLGLQTVAGASNLKIITIDKMKIKINGQTKEFVNQPVAINLQDKFSATNYQALLSPAFL